MNNKFHFNSGKNIFFTSDTHFWHTKIMEYCHRPFSSVEEMNDAIITNWNNVVPKDGHVFHLGDFGFCGSQQLKDIINSLNGHIHLIIGNHDWKMLSDETIKLFDDANQQLYIQIEGQKIYLNHFPYLCFAGSYGHKDGLNRTWQLFGHVHSTPNSNNGLDQQRLQYLFPTQYDVGVDNNSFTPISYDQVKDIINEQMLSLNLYRGTH